MQSRLVVNGTKDPVADARRRLGESGPEAVVPLAGAGAAAAGLGNITNNITVCQKSRKPCN